MTICLPFVFLFLLNIVSLHTNASTEDYEYYSDDIGIVLTKYTGSETEVIVPSEIAGKAIVKIEGTFYNNKSVEEVVLPEGINNMNVLAAHKLDGNIIGCVYDETTNGIDITLDKHPYHVEIQLNLNASN